ncbi:conjugative transposon protein TraM [Mucilaginibacter defluvii]|uniref:Conjugative transposon protein TraM n=2 Tax=Mucilaginibacter defluvii TaxID=1196019 RepID=A0ABP9FNI1_9SPHI
MFWALGGGKTDATAAPVVKDGLNMELPGAQLDKKEVFDKMSYYDKAASDSAKLQELSKNDPYYRDSAASAHIRSQLMDTGTPVATGSLQRSPLTQDANSSEQMVYKKLDELNRSLNQPPQSTMRNVNPYPTGQPPAVDNKAVDRLEGMMQAMNQNGGEDPELKQLNGMLEKILDVQHPDRVKEKIKAESAANRGKVFAVSTTGNGLPVSNLDSQQDSRSGNSVSGFFGMEQNEQKDTGNVIPATINETQTIVSGATVKLRLSTDIFINGVMIPKNTLVNGTASLNNERLSIEIKSIRYGRYLFPIQLSVYDMDGMTGIYIPGAISGEVARQSADRAVQNMGITTVDPSIEVQAASAGIEAAKTLFSKKMKLIKVTLKEGYRVLLYDEKQKDNY